MEVSYKVPEYMYIILNFDLILYQWLKVIFIFLKKTKVYVEVTLIHLAFTPGLAGNYRNNLHHNIGIPVES